jgi:hypothetical protein
MKFAIEVHKEQGTKHDIDIQLTSENPQDRALMASLHDAYSRTVRTVAKNLNKPNATLWIEFRPKKGV